jgi:hypothetical protein
MKTCWCIQQVKTFHSSFPAQQLVDEMKKEELEEVVGALDIDHESNNPHSKTVLKKRLLEKMIQIGVEDFAQNHMEQEQVGMFTSTSALLLLWSTAATLVQLLGEKPAESKKALATQLNRLTNIIGVSAFFSKCDVSFLKECMQDMKLKVQQRSIGTLLVLETHSALYLVPN